MAKLAMVQLAEDMGLDPETCTVRDFITAWKLFLAEVEESRSPGHGSDTASG